MFANPYNVIGWVDRVLVLAYLLGYLLVVVSELGYGLLGYSFHLLINNLMVDSTLIHLTAKEQQIFDTLKLILKECELKTTLRVAGGWVRDKVIIRRFYCIDYG